MRDSQLFAFAFALIVLLSSGNTLADCYIQFNSEANRVLQLGGNTRRGNFADWTACNDYQKTRSKFEQNNSSCVCPQSSAGGGIPMGFPTTEGQAQAFFVGLLFNSIMNSGPSAAAQQQQALLEQQQAEAKLQAEMLQKERAAQASEARALWENQDAARSQELANLFGPAAPTAEGTSSLLQKQAALQLRAVAAPIPLGKDENMRQRAGEGFDEAARSLAAVPAVPEPEARPARDLVLAKIDETKATVDKLDLELETTRKKQEQTRQKLEQARRELAAKQANPAPETPQDDAALLAALEAEERNIDALSKEVEENSARLKELEGQHDNAVQELEMWSGKLQFAQQ